MHEFRLGDELDDFCVKCKRLTNHAIVSLLNGQAAKVRCRTCYHDHDFRNGEPMPSKKDLKKQQLLDQALAGTAPPLDGEADEAAVTATPPVETSSEVVAVDGTIIPHGAEAPAEKKGRKTAKSKP